MNPEEITYYTVTDLEKKLGAKEPSIFTRVRKQNLSGVDIGNLVHAAIKDIHLADKMPLEQLIKTEAINLNLRITKEELEEMIQMLGTFLKSGLAPGEHELPFRLKLANAVVTGIIDFCFETKGGWVICDFKTDGAFHRKKYQWQMDIYALALSKIRPVLETRLLFLKLSKTQCEPCTPERLRRTEENLSDFLKTIR